MINLHLDNHAFLHLVRGNDRTISYLDDVPQFSHMPLGWILHVQEGNGSPFDMFNQNIKGKRKFSTLWVGKTGRIEMYGSLYKIPWAQVAGNVDYWAVETEGFSTKNLTYPQIWSLARIHAALNLASTRDLNHIANQPGDIGIGTHSMGGNAWGGHACPGVFRASERGAILKLSTRFMYKRGA